MDYSAFIEILACLSAVSFHFAAGTIFGFSAILIPKLEASDSEIKVDKDDISWIASLVALVTPLASFTTGYLVDKVGRLNTIRLATIPYVTGWICIAVSQNLGTMLLGRFLTGFSLAVGCNPAVMYITEVSRPEYRGLLSCLGPSLTSLGMVIVYAQGAFLHWRTISWLNCFYCVMPILFMTLWTPESPVWLVSKGRSQQALKSLTYLLRKDKRAGLADQRLSDLVKAHDSTPRTAQNSLTKLLRALTTPNGYKPLLLLTMIFIFQQFSGVYITIFYSVDFFKKMGTIVDPYLCTVGVGLIRLFIGIVTSFLMRHIGRRTLFMFSGTGMAIFIFTSGYYTREIMAGNMEKNLVPVVCVLLYMILGVLGLMSIPWTMTAELFPLDIRGMAQGVMISLANIIMFAALKVYPFLEGWLGGVYKVQWLFGAVASVSIVFIFLFLPETHKKELNEIQDYFAHNWIYVFHKKSKKNKQRENTVPEEGRELEPLNQKVQIVSKA